jgi:hypothetical protein
VNLAIRTTFLAALLAAALPATAQEAVQDTTPRPEEPARATSISLTGFGNTIGLWRDLSPRMRAGVEVGGYVGSAESDAAEQSSNSLLIRPSVMLFSGEGAVRPYTTVGLFVQRYAQESEHDNPDASFRDEHTDLGAQAGVGLEWRPASRATIGGHVGISGSFGHSESGTIGGNPAEADGWTVGTFSSGITVHRPPPSPPDPAPSGTERPAPCRGSRPLRHGKVDAAAKGAACRRDDTASPYGTTS